MAEAAQKDLARAYQELSARRAQGDEGNGVVADLILAAGFLHDREAVDRIAAELQGTIVRDAFEGPSLAGVVAAARAQVGETEAAVASLAHLLETPGEGALTPALLRLDPIWNPLRSDPRFQRLAGTQP